MMQQNTFDRKQSRFNFCFDLRNWSVEESKQNSTSEQQGTMTVFSIKVKLIYRSVSRTNPTEVSTHYFCFLNSFFFTLALRGLASPLRWRENSRCSNLIPRHISFIIALCSIERTRKKSCLTVLVYYQLQRHITAYIIISSEPRHKLAQLAFVSSESYVFSSCDKTFMSWLLTKKCQPFENKEWPERSRQLPACRTREIPAESCSMANTLQCCL